MRICVDAYTFVHERRSRVPQLQHQKRTTHKGQKMKREKMRLLFPTTVDLFCFGIEKTEESMVFVRGKRFIDSQIIHVAKSTPSSPKQTVRALYSCFVGR